MGTCILMKPMHFIQQPGYFLNFIDDDKGIFFSIGYFLSQVLGMFKLATKLFGLEEINPITIPVGLTQKGCLSSLPWPTKKKSFLTCEGEFQLPLNHAFRIS
jgi:hypothetical protein